MPRKTRDPKDLAHLRNIGDQVRGAQGGTVKISTRDGRSISGRLAEAPVGNDAEGFHWGAVVLDVAGRREEIDYLDIKFVFAAGDFEREDRSTAR